MSLIDCINKAGKSLNASDRAILESALSDGMTDAEALDALQASVETDLNDVVTRVEAEGQVVTLETPPAETSALMKGWDIVAGFDEAFQVAMSDAKDLGQLIDDVASEGVRETKATNKDFDVYHRVRSDVIKVQKIEIQHDAPGKGFGQAFLVESKDNVWLDISDMREGTGGSEIYAIAMNYAHNNGKVFIGDPGGLSVVAQHRRLENMISSALKFKTTDHMMPHPQQMGVFDDQVWLDDVATTGFLDDWVRGDTEGNMEKMLLLSYNNHVHFIPEIENYHYDFATDQFRDRATGDRLTPERIERLRRTKGGSKISTGGNTIKRAIFTHSLLSTDGQDRRDAWLDEQANEPLPRELRRVLYQSSLGFFSAAEEALKSMSFPKDKPLNGREIWMTISRAAGLKKAEIEWMGLEEFLGGPFAPGGKKERAKLTAEQLEGMVEHTDKAFTQQEVLGFMQAGGIQVEETYADQEKDEYASDDLDFSEGDIDDDPENWSHRVSDYEYEWDHGENPYFFEESEQRDYIEDNLTDELIEKFAEDQGWEEGQIKDMRVDTLENMAPTELYDFVENAGFDPLEELRNDMEAHFLELAEQAAETEYMDNPIRNYYATAGDNTIFISGNDDYGYRATDDLGNVIVEGEYSYNETEIQARDHAMEMGWLETASDTEVVQWARYVMTGDSSNYREIKLTLPDITPIYYKTEHFEDENIVVFIRADDRPMFTSAPPEVAPPINVEAEIAKLTDPLRIDYDGVFPEAAVQALIDTRPSASPNMMGNARTHWETSSPEERERLYTATWERGIKDINKKTSSRLTAEENEDGVDPGVAPLQRQLDEEYSDEKMQEMFEVGLKDIEKKIIKSYAEKDILPSTLEQALSRTGDYTAWETIAAEMRVDGYTNHYRDVVLIKERLKSEIANLNRYYNTIENKLERAGKGPTTSLSIQELQSDLVSDARRAGGYSTGADAGLIDAEATALVNEVEAEIDTVYDTTYLYNVNEAGERQPENTWGSVTRSELIQFRNIAWELMRKDLKHDYVSDLGKKYDRVALDLASIFDKDLKAKVQKVDALFDQVKAEREGPPDMPFKGDLAMLLGLKRAVVLAVEGGYESISWPNGEAIQARWSESYDYSAQYNMKMPSMLSRLAKTPPIELDLDGNAIVRVPEPRVDVSGWTVEREPEGLINMWSVKIPELDIDRIHTSKELGLDREDWQQLPSLEDAGMAAIKTYEKQVRMLDFYDIEQEGKEKSKGFRLFKATDQNGELVKGSSGEVIYFEDKAKMAAYLQNHFYRVHFPKAPPGNWVTPITDELKNKVETTGLPLFSAEDRGRFYPGEHDNIIQLTKASDLSSFLHESSHLFLETQKVWAQEYGADENQKAILKWLGVNNFDQITKEHHERWAETFEVYLREGTAPSLKLRQAFAAFSRWLKTIYRTLVDTRLRRADLDDEVSQIFNRMLATEEEIAEAAAHPEYDQYFRSKEQSGMSDAQWADYQKRAARVRDQAEMTVDEKVMKQYMDSKKSEWKEEKAPLIVEERERLSKLPIYQVLADVAGDKKNNVPGVPFSTDALHLLYPEGIPKKLNFRHKKEGGIDPAEYAEAYEFASAKAMLDEIVQTPALGEAAEGAAETRMKDKYGDILNDGTLEAEVREALVNEDQAEMLLLELQAMKKPKPGINRTYLKASAVKTIASMKFNEIKPGRYYRTMVKAAQDAVRMTDPTDAKIQQLSNHYLYKEAVRVREQMLKHRRYVKAVTKRKFDTNRIDARYAQKMKMLAEMYDMRQSPEQLAKLDDILNFFEGQISTDGVTGSEQTDLTMLDPNLIRALEHRGTSDSGLVEFQLTQFEDMTAEDLHGVVDMLQHLSHVGRQLAEVNGNEAIAERLELIESIRKHGGKDHPVQRGDVPPLKKPREFWGKIVNSLPSIINMTRKLDGMKEGGQAFTKILTLISDAEGKKLELHKRYYDRFESMVGDISRVNLSRMDGKNYPLESGEQLKLSSEQVFMMGLYWGTESSREAIRQGHGVTDLDVQGILSSMSQDQLGLLNAIWAMNETHWPELRATAIDQDGYAPPKLEATPFMVNGTELTGGHMQLMYDSQRLDLKNEQELGTRKGTVMPTKAGSLNSRVGSGGQPVNLDINNITRSVNDKIHFIAFAEAGRKLRRLVNHPETVAAIERKHGSGFYEAYIKSIESVTAGRVSQDSNEAISIISRWMRQSATMMHLMYSIRNTAQQFSALHISAAEVGPLRFVWASGQMLNSPRETIRMINSKSKFMENRAQVVNRDSRELMRKVISTSKVGSKYESMKAHGFMFQTFVDSTVAYPTWLAAYQRGMDQHGEEKRAQIEADSAVGQSVGSGSDLHLGRVFQSNQAEIVKTLGIFGSWFNAYYQRLYHSSKGGEDFLNVRFGMNAVLLPFIAANMAQALILDMPDEGTEDETWTDWMLKNYMVFMLGTIPLIRELASLSEGFTPSAPVSALPKAVDRIWREINAASEDRQTGLKTTVDIGRAVASVSKLPGSGQALRILEYIDSSMQGEEDGINPYQALVEGADKDG